MPEVPKVPDVPDVPKLPESPKLTVTPLTNGLHDQPSPLWKGRPYFPISEVYKARFGSKVVKIPVAIAEDCPNRLGIKGMQTCIFCDEWGSFAYPQSQNEELREQIRLHREKVKLRFNASKFLVYFQAYTTTFTQLGKLKSGIDIALENADVCGVVVGTRPDCLSQSLLEAWKQYSERTFVGIEFGVQSFVDEQLIWMRRGHTAQQSINAIERTVREAEVDVGIHLILGLPGENEKQLIETARLCNELPISNVKLHNLHVLAKTPLEQMYRLGEFMPLELEEYSDRVGVFLQHLSPKIAVHRLAALSSHWEELVAPAWTRHKMKSFQAVIDHLHSKNRFQGQLFKDALN